MKSDRKHWTNAPETNCMFITTTVRDWKPVFRRPEVREAVASCILDDHRFYGAILHAFVVMTHHVHTVSIMPSEKSSDWFGARFKSNTAKRILPLLNTTEREMLAEASPEDGRALWKRSFRGVPIVSPEVRKTKVDYIHWNPVRADFVELPADYRWSSAWIREGGHYDSELGVDLDWALDEFGPPPPFSD